MSLNILIVDDSRLSRCAIRKTLRLSGIPIDQIFEAANGREGLELMDRQWMDLLIADLNMPEMSGYQMVDRLEDSGILGDLPVVVISTERNQAQIERLLRKGVAKFIGKPFKPELLRDMVHDLFGFPMTADEE
ncbi:MAG: response regulator [Verrucomicrobiota bacterium]